MFNYIYNSRCYKRKKRYLFKFFPIVFDVNNYIWGDQIMVVKNSKLTNKEKLVAARKIIEILKANKK